jgi:hypothetical protein
MNTNHVKHPLAESILHRTRAVPLAAAQQLNASEPLNTGEDTPASAPVIKTAAAATQSAYTGDDFGLAFLHSLSANASRG